MASNQQFAVAVHVVTLLACAPDIRTSSEALASSTGSNPVHIRRVLGALRRAGLVGSRSGPTGGSVLLPDPQALTLADVWDAVHGDERVLAIHDAAPDCTAGQGIQRQLEAVERRAADALRAELEETTVADLVASVAVG